MIEDRYVFIKEILRNIYKKEDHPNIAKVLGNVAAGYINLGDNEKALEMNQQVLGILFTRRIKYELYII